MAMELDRTLNERLGTPLEKRTFRAHITTARIKGKGPIPVDRVKEVMGSTLERLKEGDYSIKADRFHLINSTLTPQGPVYDTLETYYLSRH
jgi:2'-5' RNA ligase